MELKKGNLKLSKKVGVWTIPASLSICGRVCKGCYAHKSQNQYKQALAYRTRNYEASLLPDFENEKIVGFDIIRVHESGEFYSQEYINKWVKIARNHPNIIFYAYTKRIGEFNFDELTSLKNFVLHNSLHNGKENYGKDISEVAETCGGFVCPLTLQKDWHGKCGHDCTWCMQKKNEGTPIFFEKH